MKLYLKPQIINQEYLVTRIYDFYKGLSREVNTNLRITKLDGLSQIIIDSNVYLIGSNMNKVDTDNNFSSSHLIKIEFSEQYIPHIKFLTSSLNTHYYPSLTKYKNEEIFVIGGKENVFCEVFSFRTNNWRKLRNLPTERYGSLVICEENSRKLYLFGGMNSSSNLINFSVLLYDLKINLDWDTIVVASNSHLLQRAFCGYIKIENNNIILLGGSISLQKESDDIIEFDFTTKVAIELTYKLKKPAMFFTLPSFEQDQINNIYYGFDNENNIHKLDLDMKQTFEVKFDDYIILESA